MSNSSITHSELPAVKIVSPTFTIFSFRLVLLMPTPSCNHLLSSYIQYNTTFSLERSSEIRGCVAWEKQDTFVISALLYITHYGFGLGSHLGQKAQGVMEFLSCVDLVSLYLSSVNWANTGKFIRARSAWGHWS